MRVIYSFHSDSKFTALMQKCTLTDAMDMYAYPFHSGVNYTSQQVLVLK